MSYLSDTEREQLTTRKGELDSLQSQYVDKLKTLRTENPEYFDLVKDTTLAWAEVHQKLAVVESFLTVDTNNTQTVS
jgi:hypothetical protein